MKYGILTFKEPHVDISRKILHVDMDAFYASVEMRDNSALAHKPVVIAKHPKLTFGRGIVSTCNYKARQYGIHSAMPAAQAYRLCPQAVFIPGNRPYYREVSRAIHRIFHQYTDQVEAISLDEAYLDISDNKLGISSALKVGQLIQGQIHSDLKLTCSVGVSYNKFIAKLASDYHKPFGLTLVTPDEALPFLHSLPISQFHGVGQKSQELLGQLDIQSGADLYKFSLEDLVHHFGKLGHSLYYKVRGIDNSPVRPYRDRKSIGTERTFAVFLDDHEIVLKELNRLVEKVHQSLCQKKFYCRQVSLKIRYEDFETISRQVVLDQATDQYQILQQKVYELWEEHGQLDRSVRLLGVSLSQLIDPYHQPLPIPLDLQGGK